MTWQVRGDQDWPLGHLDWHARFYGQSRHTFSAVCRSQPMFFTFWADTEEDFPRFVRTTLTKYFFGIAKCASCSATMAGFQTCTLRQMYASGDMKRSYVICGCGYPIWQMKWKSYDAARYFMEQNQRSWKRIQSLLDAGGKHTRAELQRIMESQKSRCIYCHRLFTDELVPSKDHILPVTAGGSDRALNIVLACRSCNSSRSDIPFRTFCTLLSPTQNKRILMNLARRLMLIDPETISVDELACLEEAIARHDPKHFRYRMMKGRNNRNVKTKLLPRTLLKTLRACIEG